jgi:hypothetical protein
MDPSQRRPTAADLKNQAGDLKARALQARAAARRCGDPAQTKWLERQAAYDLREAGLAERAALSLEAETGGLEAYEQLLAFQARRENRPEPRESKREGIEQAPPKGPPVGMGVEHHPWLALYPHLHARVEARGRRHERPLYPA